MDEVKILVIEDSPLTQDTLRNILSAQEAEISVVSTGEEGIELLEKGLKPNVIVLDLNLPQMDGAEVVEKLRSDIRWKNIPVIPFSALWSERTDEPFKKDLEIVKKWMAAARTNEKAGGSLASVTPKYHGQEDTDVVHPRLIVSVAKVLIQMGQELSPAFQHLVLLSQNQLEETKK